jgi:hypothetical protein
MDIITIKATLGSNELPQLSHTPSADEIGELLGSNLQFVIDNSVLSYVENSDFVVTLTWKGVDKVLTPSNVSNLIYPVEGQLGEVHSYTVTIKLAIASGKLGENSTTTTGDIIIQ